MNRQHAELLGFAFAFITMWVSKLIIYVPVVFALGWFGDNVLHVPTGLSFLTGIVLGLCIYAILDIEVEHFWRIQIEKHEKKEQQRT